MISLVTMPSVRVHYVPTSEEAVQAMLALGEVTERDVVCDLGCGDGRIVIAAARMFRARGLGVDVDPELVLQARENAAKAGVEHLVRFEEKDMFDVDLREVTVVTLFLMPNINELLAPKLLAELRPGARILSNTFGIGDWKPDAEATVGEVEDEDHHISHKLYVWNVRPRV